MHGNKRKRLDLPDEIVEKILLKLPVKSLIRFKCVCKAWSAYLQNPDFIRAHYQNQVIVDAAGSRASKFLLKRSDGGTNFYFTSLECRVDEEDEVNVKEKENIFLPVLGVKKRTAWIYRRGSVPRVLGPCNGIVCLNDDINTALWNPATREFKFLPTSNVEEDEDNKVSCSYAMAFGHDHKTDDYKVLRCVEYSKWSNVRHIIFHYELYSLRKNEWREIQDQHCFLSASRRLSMFMDGVYLTGYYNDAIGVMSFDMFDEVFTLTEYPRHWWRTFGERLLALAPFNKCPAAVWYNFHGCSFEESRLEIWVLKEIGVTESWTKELTTRPIPRVLTLLGFWKERIFGETKDRRIVVYNLNSQAVRSLGLRLPCLYSTQFINYVESLVLINGRPELEVGMVRSLS